MVNQKCPYVIASVILFMLMAAVPVQSVSSPSKVDNRLYDELLKKYVLNGQVNYKGLKSDESRLDAYLNHLAIIRPNRLERKDRFAFYINAYNAWTIKLILDHYPGISSIKDIGGIFSSPWKKKIARINGELITLDHIEHDILRPQFKDPRVHFAINCAARSCPPLANFAFNGKELDEQLDLLTRKFINNSHSNYLKDDTLWVSRIFKWFGEDFNDDIIGFIETYAQKDFKGLLNSPKKKIKIKYLDYDWALNGN